MKIKAYRKKEEFEVIIDDEDYIKLSGRKIQISTNGYPCISIGWKMVKIHSIVLQKRIGKIVDHINCNKLDNRKENLRYVTYSENLHNKGKRKDNSTGFTNIYKIKNAWYFRIQLKEKDFGRSFKCPLMAFYFKEKFLKENDIYRHLK